MQEYEIQQSIDVREILDIPNIEKYLDEEFSFSVHSKNDAITAYNYSNKEVTVRIDFWVEDQMLFKIDTLRKLLFSKNKVEYLDFAIADNESGGLIQQHCYRPLASDKHRGFTNE